MERTSDDARVLLGDDLVVEAGRDLLLVDVVVLLAELPADPAALHGVVEDEDVVPVRRSGHQLAERLAVVAVQGDLHLPKKWVFDRNFRLISFFFHLQSTGVAAGLLIGL